MGLNHLNVFKGKGVYVIRLIFFICDSITNNTVSEHEYNNILNKKLKNINKTSYDYNGIQICKASKYGNGTIFAEILKRFNEILKMIMQIH